MCRKCSVRSTRESTLANLFESGRRSGFAFAQRFCPGDPFGLRGRVAFRRASPDGAPAFVRSFSPARTPLPVRIVRRAGRLEPRDHLGLPQGAAHRFAGRTLRLSRQLLLSLTRLCLVLGNLRHRLLLSRTFLVSWTARCRAHGVRLGVWRGGCIWGTRGGRC